jgi:phage shock protein A
MARYQRAWRRRTSAMDLHARLQGHIELMSKVTEWTHKAQAAMETGKRALADQHLKRAEDYLAEARKLEPQVRDHNI